MNESENDYERYHIETERQRLARAEYDDYLLNYDPARDLASTPAVVEQILLGWLKAQIPHETRMQIHKVLHRIRTWRGHQSDYRQMLADRA